MDFTTLGKDEPMITNPYAGKTHDGQWISGYVSVDFLNTNFGQYNNAKDMNNATQSEGLQKFFDWLASEGEIPAT